MPTVLRERGYRFFFYAADRYEPPHIHVQRERSSAKLWLDPIEIARVKHFRPQELNEIVRITEAHLEEFLAVWYRQFGGLAND
jgi:hypothetical protein